MNCKNKKDIKIAIVSYQAWKHPRAIKILKTLRKHGFKNARIWSPRQPVRKGPRLIKSILNYGLASIETLLINADLIWLENVPDIIYSLVPLSGKKYIYDRRSPWYKQIIVEFNLSGITKKALKVLELIERNLIAHSTAVVVVSRAMKYEFKYPDSKPVYVINNYPEKAFIKQNIEPIRRTLGIDDNTKIFGFIGRLTKIEGADILPQIAVGIKKAGNAQLWILGDGPYAHLIEWLQKKMPEVVKWFGYVSRDKIPSYIMSFNFGLVPRPETPYSIFYTHEGIHKIAEYFAYGIPVIASGIGPSPFYLKIRTKELPAIIQKIIKNEISVPSPPKGLTWEQYSEPVISKLAEKIFCIE